MKKNKQDLVERHIYLEDWLKDNYPDNITDNEILSYFMNNFTNKHDILYLIEAYFLPKEDIEEYKENKKLAGQALKKCKKIVKEMNLEMDVIEAYFTLDKDHLIFNFYADNRVDFRELAKELAYIYKTRIELRQIGVRDKAKKIGGLGCCGRELCCAKFLNKFDSVTISMAKNQNLSLNPNKINGVCGRLLCCLKYEDDGYKECRKCLPKVGQIIEVENGKGKVTSIDVLNKKIKIELENGNVIEEQIKNGSN